MECYFAWIAFGLDHLRSSRRIVRLLIPDPRGPVVISTGHLSHTPVMRSAKLDDVAREVFYICGMTMADPFGVAVGDGVLGQVRQAISYHPGC